MAKTYFPSQCVDRVGDPFAFIVTAPMLNTPKHGADVIFWLETYDAGDTTHSGVGLWSLNFVPSALYYELRANGGSSPTVKEGSCALSLSCRSQALLDSRATAAQFPQAFAPAANPVLETLL